MIEIELDFYQQKLNLGMAHEFWNDLRLRMLGNEKILGKSQNLPEIKLWQ